MADIPTAHDIEYPNGSSWIPLGKHLGYPADALTVTIIEDNVLIVRTNDGVEQGIPNGKWRIKPVALTTV
ncbi:MAG: hypothetical protein AB203_04570 [Parcubacteria bacterium C7867-008]|nr:MAG: hypothetical protein AB203_04570 [Parcubacteria bacterium C7867-008]